MDKNILTQEEFRLLNAAQPLLPLFLCSCLSQGTWPVSLPALMNFQPPFYGFVGFSVTHSSRQMQHEEEGNRVPSKNHWLEALLLLEDEQS